ncbi:hypothetical protein BC628DRAFT_120527 [Trametes gibbosa]|nr:hypothetical protein BC628DRAFT_120527 [Trametes gibbosa]
MTSVMVKSITLTQYNIGSRLICSDVDSEHRRANTSLRAGEADIIARCVLMHKQVSLRSLLRMDSAASVLKHVSTRPTAQGDLHFARLLAQQERLGLGVVTWILETLDDCPIQRLIAPVNQPPANIKTNTVRRTSIQTNEHSALPYLLLQLRVKTLLVRANAGRAPLVGC